MNRNLVFLIRFFEFADTTNAIIRERERTSFDIALLLQAVRFEPAYFLQWPKSRLPVSMITDWDSATSSSCVFESICSS